MKSFVGTSWVALLQADSGTWAPLSRGSAMSHGPESSTDLYIQLEDAEGERIIPEYGPDLHAVLITSAEGGQECNVAAGLEGTGK